MAPREGNTAPGVGGAPSNEAPDTATVAATPNAAARAAAAAAQSEPLHARTLMLGPAAAPAAVDPPHAPLPSGPSDDLPRASTEPQAGADPLIGTVVASRYRLIEKLGTGGMGAVYRGEHVTLKKRVAVKFLHREMSANRELVARFEREAIAAANLDHPNVVAATDYGRTADGMFFLVMEFVEGRSLRQLMQHEGRLTLVRAFKLLKQIGAALARAHALGIVHRDLKPENIVVAEREGEHDLVKVIDFGIARVTGSAFGAQGTQLTQLGAVFGTPEYMAPEQAMGQPVDGRADQYALGVIAFELFTGRRPFHADDAIDLLRLHVGAPVPAATSFARDLPPALDAPIARMLAKHPAARFDSVAAAIDAIDAALQTAAAAPFAGPAAPFAGAPAPFTAAPPYTAAPGGAFAPAALAPAPQPASGVGTLGFHASRGVLLGIAVAAVGLSIFIAIVAFTLRQRAARDGSGGSNTAITRDGRPLADRLAEYQLAPDVANALSLSLRGDAEAAEHLLQARRARDPQDALAAYFLGTVYWTARRPAEAVEQFRAALEREPALGTDPTLTTAVVGALAEPRSARAASALLRSPLLAQSRAAAQAAAEAAINGANTDTRARALGVASEPAMMGLLPPLLRARVMLRAAQTCADLNAAVAALEALGPGVAAEEVQMVHAGQCELLQIRECRECLEDRGGGGH